MKFCIIPLKERDASKGKYPSRGIRQIHGNEVMPYSKILLGAFKGATLSDLLKGTGLIRKEPYKLRDAKRLDTADSNDR
jgi:hypothetical protein